MRAAEKEQLEKIKARMESGELVEQKCWSFIRELNSCSAQRLDSGGSFVYTEIKGVIG